jgi:hypothetical protein
LGKKCLDEVLRVGPEKELNILDDELLLAIVGQTGDKLRVEIHVSL